MVYTTGSPHNLLVTWNSNTVFIRLSAQGAYLIFGLSGWAFIRGGRLFEAGRLLNFHHFQ